MRKIPFVALVSGMVLAVGAGCYGGADVGTTGTSGGGGGASTGDTTDGGTSDGGETSDGGTSGNDPFAAAPTCTSGQTSTVSEGSTMQPGGACVSCHASRGGPSFAVGGTVFPTGHEPTKCVGSNGRTDGLTVVITDANKQEIRLPVNSVGNFSSTSRQSIAMPYTAKVVNTAGAERAMGSPQSSGDCNSCHTESGANGAPGRIVAP